MLRKTLKENKEQIQQMSFTVTQTVFNRKQAKCTNNDIDTTLQKVQWQLENMRIFEN